MRQVLPSLLKTLHRGQKSSICESGKGDEGGRPSEVSCLPRSVFSKSSFPKLTPLISMIFVHDEPILKKKAFSSSRLKKFRRGSGGRAPAIALDTPRIGTRPSSDSPRCTVNRDVTPPGGVFREQGGKLVVKRASCALLFLLLLSNEKIVTRPFVGKGVPVGLQESENAGFRRFECCTTLPTDHDVGGVVCSVSLFRPPSRDAHLRTPISRLPCSSYCGRIVCFVPPPRGIGAR